MTQWRGVVLGGTVRPLMKGETMTTGNDQLLAGADTLSSVRQRLLDLGKAALGKHPLLMAMATQIRVTEQGALWVTFDSPALPEKQQCEVLLPTDPESHRDALAAFMQGCEERLAATMRKAGLALASPGLVIRGATSKDVGNPACDHRYGSHGDTCVKCGAGAY